MELSQIFYFSKIAKGENIAQAAKELYISQSTLSRSISKLEEELGVHLFERTGNKIRINQFGKRFETHVDRILQELENAREELG